jgi:hypothetical protein
MTPWAWLTMLVTWSVITFFTVRFFWMCVRTGDSEEDDEE